MLRGKALRGSVTPTVRESLWGSVFGPAFSSLERVPWMRPTPRPVLAATLGSTALGEAVLEDVIQR